MKVSRLIEILQQCPPDARVGVEAISTGDIEDVNLVVVGPQADGPQAVSIHGDQDQHLRDITKGFVTENDGRWFE